MKRAVKILFILTLLLSACGGDNTADGIFFSDAMLLVETIEDTHPIFLMDGMLPDDYDERRQAFLNEAAQDMTVEEFELAIQRYLTVLRDWHMMRRHFSGGFLSSQWFYRDGNILSSVIANNEHIYAEVVEVGGVPIEEILAVVDRHYYFENEIGRQLVYPVMSANMLILDMAGAEMIFVDHLGWRMLVSMRNPNSGEISTILYAPTRFSETELLRMRTADYVVRHEMMGEVFYIDLRRFEPDAADEINATVEAIENAVESGIRQFIVDLRDNPGGISGVGTRLLNAMNIKHPNFGRQLRFTYLNIASAARNIGRDETADELMANRNDFDNIGNSLMQSNPSMETSNPNDIFISVLVNANTASAATMFATWIQDGNLGNVIGRPGANSPTMFAGMRDFSLPVSGIDWQISDSYFTRPDENADQRVLWPDILIGEDEDALEIALTGFR